MPVRCAVGCLIARKTDILKVRPPCSRRSPSASLPPSDPFPAARTLLHPSLRSSFCMQVNINEVGGAAKPVDDVQDEEGYPWRNKEVSCGCCCGAFRRDARPQACSRVRGGSPLSAVHGGADSERVTDCRDLP
jgi:hypothetical protein